MLGSNVTVKSLLSISLVLALSVQVYPCTVFFLPQSTDQVVAINMDWATGQGLIFINKRDVHKVAAFVSGQTPLQWTSQYMSLTFTETGLEFPWEGMNEKGLSVHLLLSNSTVLPPTSDPRPAINGIQWVQYILDTAATTAQAIANAEATRVSGPFGATEHYFVCDAGGNCAAFDYLNGQLAVTQGSQIPMVLANDPYYLDYQKLTSTEAIFSPAQIEALTGTDSMTRFAKAAAFSTQYTPQSEEVSYALNALNNLTESDTQWRLVFSLANQTVQYKTTTATGLKYIDLQQFNPSCSSGVQWHYLNALTSGDITSQFSNYSPSANNVLVQSNSTFSASTISTLENFPSTTQCEETTTTLSANVNPSALGQPVNLVAQVTGNGPTLPTGTVKFLNGANPLGTATLNSAGVAQLSTSTLASGSNPLTVVYAGDALNLTSTSPTLWQGVNVQPTQVSLSSSLNPADVNQFVTLTAAVNGRSGVPTGNVAFYDGPVALGNVSLNSQGAAQFTSSGLIAGTHSISAIYSGDAHNAGSASGSLAETVNSQSTLTTLTSSINPTDVAQASTFTAQIEGANGAIPTGTVAFSFNGTVVSPIVRLQAGQGNITKSLSTTGSRSVAAVYSGDRSSQPSTSATLTQSVNAQPSQILLNSSHSPATVNQSVTYVATVTGQFGGAPTGSVTFSVNGSAVATSTLSSGQANFTTAFSATGTETISATYSGDANDLPASSTFTQAVNTQQITQTSLTASLNPATVGQSVTYTANVTAPTGVPTGNVTFSYAGNPLATVPLSGGQASYIRTLTATGTRSVTATYSGDATNQTSTSATLNEVVNAQPTQTGLVSSLNPAAVDQPITLTAAVTGQYGAPVTGTVTFKDNGTTMQTVPVSNGQAILSASLPAAGTQSISAAYSGDGNNQASTSSSLSETVNQQNSQITLTSSTSSSSVNQAVTFSAAVAGQYGGIPTGSVAFTISGNKPITVALVGGQASFTWTFLYAGARAVTANYLGDANDLPSVSATLNQTVNP